MANGANVLQRVWQNLFILQVLHK